MLVRIRITLIFGTNGSGKSSLCGSLKVLASPEKPIRPLQNVRGTSAPNPEFQYKFKSDALPTIWTAQSGYGLHRTKVNYFDTSVAIKNVKERVEPQRIVELAPFKLHLFASVKSMTTGLRESLQKIQQENSRKLIEALESIRKEFASFSGQPLSILDIKTIDSLPAQIKRGEEFSDHNSLIQLRAEVAEMERGKSADSLKLLRAEHSEKNAFQAEIVQFIAAVDSMWALEPSIKSKTLDEKKSEQELAVKTLLQEGSTLEALKMLLRAALPILNSENPSSHECPLCRRELGSLELALFDSYRRVLDSENEEVITTLTAEIDKASKFANSVRELDTSAWQKYSTIEQEVLNMARAAAELIVPSCDLSQIPTFDAHEALERLRAATIQLGTELQSKKNAIDAAAKGADEFLDGLEQLKASVKQLEYFQAIEENLAKLREANLMAEFVAFLNSKLPGFTNLLKKVTERAKEAHEDLVVPDFEKRLNDEYLALTEKNMASFGVSLSPKGSDGMVTILPQIGGQFIEGVMSA